jgi:putative transposase
LSFTSDPAIDNSNIPPFSEAIKQYRRLRRNMLISKILGKFQQQTSKQVNLLRNTPGVKVWQKDYHDHIIRDIQSYHRIKHYIINNPKNWKGDTFYRPR